MRAPLSIALVAVATWSSGCGSSGSKQSCNCPAGQTCVGTQCLAAASGCALPPVRAAAAQLPVQVTELAGGSSPAPVGTTLTFDVPAGTQSISITEQAVTLGSPAVSIQFPGQSAYADYNSATPLQLLDPSGSTFFDDRTTGSTDPEKELVYYGASSPGAGTITIPGTSAALELARSGLPVGTWKVVVSDYAYECSLPAAPCTAGASTQGTYGVAVVTKQGTPGALPASGTLDVVFYVVTSGIQASAAASDLDLMRMQRTYSTLLARAGITLGSVSYVAADPSVMQRFASGVQGDDAGACGEVAQLLSTSQPNTRAMNVFLVPYITTNDQSTPGAHTVGLDGSIPAPATISGTVWSGILVSAENLRDAAYPGACSAGVSPVACGADTVGYVAAHETGHALGLYHVTESTGTYFDPLTDTPRCACLGCATVASQCADAASPPSTPYMMKVADCTQSAACAGGDNLMFWLVSSSSSGQLTGEQAEVMRANPYVY